MKTLEEKLWRDPKTQLQMAYWNSGSGPAVVLLHAFPLSKQMWEPQLELANRYRLLLPDVHGFGGSNLSAAGWTVDSLASLLADWLQEIGLDEPIVLGGLSMGGYIAMAFARHHTSRLRGLILANTRCEADSDEVKVGRNSTIQAVHEKGSKHLIETMMPKLFADSADPEAKQFVRELGTAQSIDAIASALIALRDRPDSTATLQNLQIPTLILVGSDDQITPVKHAETMHQLLAKSTLEIIPNAGHLSNLEQPKVFNEHIDRFLKSISRA